MLKRAARRDGGFTYFGVIILVFIIGLVAAATLKMGALLQRRAAEQELLYVGAQFSDALQSYAAATPAGLPQQPPTLQDLLRDPRFPSPRRHLRKLFVDPVTGKAEWGILYMAGQRGVIGVYSLSPARPIKIGNFDDRFKGFENKQHLSDWKFVTAGQTVLAPAQQPAAQPGTATPAPVVPEPALPQPAEPEEPAPETPPTTDAL